MSTSYPKKGSNRTGTSYDKGKTYTPSKKKRATLKGGALDAASPSTRSKRIDQIISGNAPDVRVKE